MNLGTLPSAAEGHTIGMDIGGSHVSAVRVAQPGGALLHETMASLPVDASAPAEEVLGVWAAALRRAMEGAGEGTPLLGVGVAMPGPFDYPNGICLMEGVAKYDTLHGVNIRREMKDRVPLAKGIPLVFLNDASCFLLGEAVAGAAKGADRVIGLTLGTGFGSAFLAGGRIVESGPGVPENGWLYNAPFGGTTAEECFSGRGLLALAEEMTGRRPPSLRHLAGQVRAGEADRRIFERYGALLGEFLAPWARGFSSEIIIIGGNISRSMDLFSEALDSALGHSVLTRASLLREDAALAGAGFLPLAYNEPGWGENT